jgi:hypothetical protein
MMPAIVAVALLAILVGWMRLMRRQFAQRPLWMAFSATAAGIFFLATGVAGYTLSKHDRFVAQTRWANHVIWSQVGFGALTGLLAVYLWRRALTGSPH